jgi:hypothetical protein
VLQFSLVHCVVVLAVLHAVFWELNFQFYSFQPFQSYTTWKTGTRVEADYRLEGIYYPGKIAINHKDGKYDIFYDDNCYEKHVHCRYIKLLNDSELPTPIPVFNIGDKIEARFKGENHYYPGHIRAVHTNDTYHIAYNDGDLEDDVSCYLIRLLPPANNNNNHAVPVVPINNDSHLPTHSNATSSVPITAASTTTTNNNDNNKKHITMAAGHHNHPKEDHTIHAPLHIKCEVNYKGKGIYYPGHIERVHKNGTYDIAYDDGTFEMTVTAHLIRCDEPLPTLSATTPTTTNITATTTASATESAHVPPSAAATVVILPLLQ